MKEEQIDKIIDALRAIAITLMAIMLFLVSFLIKYYQ